MVALGSLLALIIAAGHARATTAPSSGAAAPSTEDAAKAALARAREAARAKDYATALRHYQQALRLQPSAKLHFNVGVCHHRLMMSHEPGSAPYEQQRAAAVAAYNHYLEAAPGAADTEEVAQMIRGLGGTPLVDDPEPWTIELVEPDEVPDPPGLDHGDGDVDDTDDRSPEPTHVADSSPIPSDPPAVTATPPTVPRGRFGVFVPVIMSNPRELAASEALRALPSLGLGVRGNAFLGQRRGIALGGELAVTVQPSSARERHRLHTSYVGVLLEVRRPLGDGRFELGGGGVLGLGWQSVVYRGADRLPCAVGREASRRSGLWAGARLTLAALLGPRRNHELSLRVGPGLGAYGEGSRASEAADGTSCADVPRAFDTLGIDEGAALVVSVDIGYAPRF